MQSYNLLIIPVYQINHSEGAINSERKVMGDDYFPRKGQN